MNASHSMQTEPLEIPPQGFVTSREMIWDTLKDEPPWTEDELRTGIRYSRIPNQGEHDHSATYFPN